MYRLRLECSGAWNSRGGWNQALTSGVALPQQLANAPLVFEWEMPFKEDRVPLE